jgi:hypothetical protein
MVPIWARNGVENPTKSCPVEGLGFVWSFSKKEKTIALVFVGWLSEVWGQNQKNSCPVLGFGCFKSKRYHPSDQV